MAAAMLASVSMGAFAPLATAQDFPQRPVSLVLPFPPGGSTDVLGRLLATGMEKALGQPVVVENVGGAGGTVGAARVARARADGYTLLFNNMSQSTAKALYRSLSYDPLGSFEPVGLVADVPMILVARKGFPALQLPKLREYAAEQRDKVMFANAGVGSTSWLCALLLQQALKTQMTLVPFRGTGPALNDLLGGQVDLICDQPASTTGHLSTGGIKGVAVANAKRLPTLPDVPTFAESGLPDFDLFVWHGLYTPKGTPQPVVQRLASALQQALADPTVRERMVQLGAAPVDAARATPKALGDFLQADMDRWAPIIRASGQFAD